MCKVGIHIIAVALVLSSCGTFHQIQKSKDVDAKFVAAKNYFQDKKYNKAATLFDEISVHFRGTMQAQEILFLLSESYFGQKDYYAAVEHYEIYLKNYPQGEYVRESNFMRGLSYYKLSPDARLDQEYTLKGISALEDYVALYPNSDKTAEAYGYLNELKEKLARKAYLNCRTYYNLGIYLGNNYRSAIICAENAIRNYPESEYCDDLHFIILKSKWKEAQHSIEERKAERYSEVVDEYYNYINEFPEGKNLKDAEKILKEAKNFLKEK